MRHVTTSSKIRNWIKNWYPRGKSIYFVLLFEQCLLYEYLSHLSDPFNYAAGSTDVTMHMEIVFRGAYAYYLQHYLKWFKRDQILILNANLLKTNPAKLLIQTQGKLNRKIL